MFWIELKYAGLFLLAILYMYKYVYIFCRWTMKSRVADSWCNLSVSKDTDVLSVWFNIKLIYVGNVCNCFDNWKSYLYYYCIIICSFDNTLIAVLWYNMHCICWIYIVSYWYPSLTQLVVIVVSYKNCQKYGGIGYVSKVVDRAGYLFLLFGKHNPLVIGKVENGISLSPLSLSLWFSSVSKVVCSDYLVKYKMF